MAAPLLHLITTAEWRAALATGAVAPPSLSEIGFVHLSTPAQVAIPANAVFAGRRDVSLLVLDAERLGIEVRWEDGHPPAADGMQFPHAYGPVPVAAVQAVLPYRPGADGRFTAPEVPAMTPAARVGGFEPSVVRRAATTEVPVTGGVAVLTTTVPGSHMHNQLLVDPLLVDGATDATQLVADAERVLGGAGLRHRKIHLGAGHATTAAALAALGWDVRRIVDMVTPPGGEPADPRAEVVDLDDLRPMWAATWRRDVPGISDDVITQLADRNRLDEAVADIRYLGVRAGGAVVASCLLKIDGGTAFIDAVNTDPDHRGKGHGDALLATARALAAEAGCDLIGLGALDSDWPREWYARRGFAIVGECWEAGLR